MSLASLGTTLLAVALGTWLLCSAVAQVKPLRRRLLWWWDVSPFGALLPVFTFFAPRPATRDLRLMRRYWVDGEPDPWTEVLLAQRWRWFHVAWNPSKRQGKALTDLMRELAKLSEATPVAHTLSNYYLQVLTLVDGLPAPSSATHVQFAVVSTGGFLQPAEARLYVASERHVLSAVARRTRTEVAS